VGLSAGDGGGAGEVVGAEAVAEGAARAALTLGAEVEAGALIAGLGLRKLHVSGGDAEFFFGAGGRRDGEFSGGMDLEGGVGFWRRIQETSLTG